MTWSGTSTVLSGVMAGVRAEVDSQRARWDAIGLAAQEWAKLLGQPLDRLSERDYPGAPVTQSGQRSETVTFDLKKINPDALRRIMGDGSV